MLVVKPLAPSSSPYWLYSSSSYPSYLACGTDSESADHVTICLCIDGISPLCRRYSRLENSYFRLNQDRNVHLTLDEDDSDDDSPLALARSHDDTKATNNDDDDEDDDKLLNDV